MAIAAQGIVFVAKFLIVFALVPAVSAKLGRSSSVATSLNKWKLFPVGVTLPLARFAVLLELCILMSLAANVGTRLGAIAGVLLFGTIAVAASSVLARGIATSCSCFSLEGTERLSKVTVARAGTFALLSGIVAFGSDWTMTLKLDWSSMLLVLTIPLWIGLARRTFGSSRLTPTQVLPDSDGP